MRFLPFITSILFMVSVFMLTRFGGRLIWDKCAKHAQHEAEKFQSWSDELSLGWDENRSRMIACAARASVLLVTGLIWILSGRLVFAIAIGFVVFKFPGFLFKIAHDKRLEMIDHQLPNAINVMVSSARAGRSLQQAIADVAAKSPDPIRQIFNGIADQIDRGGVSVDKALDRARSKTPVESFRMVTTALIINCSKGGDVLHILERMADAIRELSRLRQKISTETAQVRSQEKCILLLTPVMGTLVCFFDPRIPEVLFNEFIGNILLIVVIALQAASVFWIRRIIKTMV